MNKGTTLFFGAERMSEKYMVASIVNLPDVYPRKSL